MSKTHSQQRTHTASLYYKTLTLFAMEALITTHDAHTIEPTFECRTFKKNRINAVYFYSVEFEATTNTTIARKSQSTESWIENSDNMLCSVDVYVCIRDVHVCACGRAHSQRYTLTAMVVVIWTHVYDDCQMETSLWKASVTAHTVSAHSFLLLILVHNSTLFAMETTHKHEAN